MSQSHHLSQSSDDSNAGLPLFLLCVMSAVTFMAVLSELAPTGVLPEMAKGLNTSKTSIGNLVGFYAFSAAVFSIPMVALTLRIDRKKVLLCLMSGFAAINLIITFSENYYLTAACRIIGGLCAGTMWPMIGAYGLRLVPPSLHGRAIVIIFGGTSLATSLGMPLLATIAGATHWRVEFAIITAILIALILISWRYLPNAPGVQPHKHEPIWRIFTNHYVFSSIALIFLTVTGLYCVYIYITELVSQNHVWGGRVLAMGLYGVGSLVSIFYAGKYIDAYFQKMLLLLLGLGVIAMLILSLAGGVPIAGHFGFVLFGACYGMLTTYQSIVTKHLTSGQDIAIALQVVTFNTSIMVASQLGGFINDNFGITYVIVMSLGFLLAACLLIMIDRRTYLIGTKEQH